MTDDPRRDGADDSEGPGRPEGPDRFDGPDRAYGPDHTDDSDEYDASVDSDTEPVESAPEPPRERLTHRERLERRERERRERPDRFDRPDRQELLDRQDRRDRLGRLDQPREPRALRLPRMDAEEFGRWSEAIARFMGTAKFLVYMTLFIVAWIGWNTLAPRQLRFDPYTFTFLTLILSLQASYAAPLILLAQNRQADRDRLAMEEDRRRASMQKADTEYLAREIAALRIALGEVATRDFLRSEITRLVEELGPEGDLAERREAVRRQLKLERKEQQKKRQRADRAAGVDQPLTGDSD